MAEGAVKFLLDQLSLWLREQRQQLGGLEREVEYIRDEMGQMTEFLRVADANEESSPSPNLGECVRQVREISYDVQDVLDKYMLRLGRHRDTNVLRKAFASVKNLNARRLIYSEIKAIKKRLDNVSRSQQRFREMYDALDKGSSSTLQINEEYDGRGDALFLEETDVVGIEKPKKQILEWIWSMDVGLEVISVVGMGGLGKTTLVKKVYDDELVKEHFGRHVWIVVSDYKDVKQLLANLIKKLVEEIQKSQPGELQTMSVDETMSVDDMRNFIYDFLKEKNYIIVLDDVWHLSTWEAIRFALPKRGAHGCVIITTRFDIIGSAACSETDHVYKMERLPAEESKELFYKKAFPKNPCPPYLREFAENILKRCAGLPLAIVVIGGLLATKNTRAEEWELFNRGLGHELEGEGLQRLRKLLSLSYNDLPYYLKYCFLYLSVFPEGGLLEKEKIIRLWIAEGFVLSNQDRTMEEVAGNYLNELISRSLIQVEGKDIDGRARAFRIHDLLREYITTKSREQDILTIYNGGEMQWPNKIRRLAIQKSISSFQEINKFEYLRSLVLLCDGNLAVPDAIKEVLSRCRLLKVLDLRGAPLETIPNEVFKLYHLKYLCLRDTEVKSIPKSIKYLENLETLDLKRTNVTELPIEILNLHKLWQLLVYKYKGLLGFKFDDIHSVKVPCNIGSCLLSLQKLICIDADGVDGIKIVKGIGKLTQLRRLGITKLRSEDGKELCSSIAKLTNLRSLRISAVEESEKLDLDYSLSSTLPFLRGLHLGGCLEKVPQWIPFLHGLTNLMLYWSKLREDPLNCFQDLPNLARLVVHGAYVEGLSFKADGFPKLRILWLEELTCLEWVIVEKGSMPFLQKWYMSGCKLLTDLPRGIEHLTNLQFVSFCNMEHEFVDRVVEEKNSQGDNGRLAHVTRVRFGTVKDGKWRFDFDL